MKFYADVHRSKRNGEGCRITYTTDGITFKHVDSFSEIPARPGDKLFMDTLPPQHTDGAIELLRKGVEIYYLRRLRTKFLCGAWGWPCVARVSRLLGLLMMMFSPTGFILYTLWIFGYIPGLDPWLAVLVTNYAIATAFFGVLGVLGYLVLTAPREHRRRGEGQRE